MGNFASNLNNQEPDFSSSEESEEHIVHIEMNQPRDTSSILNLDTSSILNLDTDAINPQSILTKDLDFSTINIISIQEMEECLEDYEKVSLIFLLSENVQDCIDTLSLHEWAQRESKENNKWSGKLLEALAIIQNYQIPKKYGFTKDKLIREFYPAYYFTSKYVSTYRKVIYCFCEKLTAADEECFLRNVEVDIRKYDLNFKRYPFMEMNFSYFLKIGYISQTNVQNCLQILKMMDSEYLYDMLKMVNTEEKSLERSIHTKIGNDQDVKLGEDIPKDTDLSANFQEYNLYNSSLESNVSNSTQDNNQNSRQGLDNNFTSNILKDSDNIYDTTSNKIAFIIDQENFYTETNPEYKDLLPDNVETEKLHTRTGTSLDSKKLEETLKKKKFLVDIKRNLTHLRMISELKATVKKIDKNNCSCFLVSILSHGDEGVIYGCNSCHVEVSTIIEIMSDVKLNKIPKILILQSCQGPNLQKAKRIYDNIELDGPSLRVQPSMKIPDFLIFWATVPGFSAIRNKTSGTWFIQSLCNHLEKADNQEHFEEICTKIIRDVTNKKYQKENDEFYMVPYKCTTLIKKLFL